VSAVTIGVHGAKRMFDKSGPLLGTGVSLPSENYHGIKCFILEPCWLLCKSMGSLRQSC
jgi:hypothetical protein